MTFFFLPARLVMYSALTNGMVFIVSSPFLSNQNFIPKMHEETKHDSDLKIKQKEDGRNFNWNDFRIRLQFYFLFSSLSVVNISDELISRIIDLDLWNYIRNLCESECVGAALFIIPILKVRVEVSCRSTINIRNYQTNLHHHHYAED